MPYENMNQRARTSVDETHSNVEVSQVELAPFIDVSKSPSISCKDELVSEN